jgi:hypothetical protein
MTYVSEITADISDQQLLARDYLSTYFDHSRSIQEDMEGEVGEFKGREGIRGDT